MRLPVDPAPSAPLCPSSPLFLAALTLSLALAVGGAPAQAKRAPAAPAIENGPAADYPVTVGEPFTIGSVTWTPSDQLNYDAVGHASIGQTGLVGISAAHKTLPVPSYAEVTALDTGKTVLVRIERRGPMDNDTLVDLSADAAAQLGMTARSQAAVRVRRVNPPEQERALLRMGNSVPPRMDTPEALLKVLRRKLDTQSPLLPPPSIPPAMPRGNPILAGTDAKPAYSRPAPVASHSAPPPARPTVSAPSAPARVAALAAPNKPEPKAAPKATAPAKPARGSLFVQIGAFSSEANARRAAGKLGAQVSRAGNLWRVRLGPFANRGQAGSALENVRARGYSDARIMNAD